MNLKQGLISSDITNALEGKVETAATIPAFLTSQKLLEINQKLLDAVLKETEKIVGKLAKTQRKISASDLMVLEKEDNLQRLDVR